MVVKRGQQLCLLAVALAAVCFGCVIQLHAQQNDDIFPSAPAAKASIDFDGHGFLIHGQRTWLSSGSIHFPRVPRAQWRERMLQMKRAGFNTVQTYVFWNINEEKEGVFDFTGEKDLGAFLDTAHELGMYTVVRVGPYVCAEWADGGYPNWLKFKDVLVRADDPEFVKYAERWYDHVLPIVAAHQIHRGGSVIMVQLENEHPNGWGMAVTPYFQHLLDNARRNGIEVPTFFSGLHHGPDPAPGRPLDATKRKTPWYTTEFWTSWYSNYGELPVTNTPKINGSLRKFERGTWRVLENGGSGFNYYMVHGGTNFALWGDDEGAASYDYGTSIGEAGDLHTLYYRAKRINSYARSFETILENADDSSAAQAGVTKDVKVVARTGPAGTVVFLDNADEKEVVAHLEDGSSIRMQPGEVVGLVKNFVLDPEFTLAASGMRIYGVAKQDATTTLLVHGLAGEQGALYLKRTGGGALPEGWTEGPEGILKLNATIPAGKPREYRLSSGGRTLRVLVMTTQQIDRTWVVDADGATYVVTGPSFLGEVKTKNGALTGTVETPFLAKGESSAAFVYGPKDDPVAMHIGSVGSAKVTAPVLAKWEAASAVGEAAPSYNDAGWVRVGEPRDMSSNGLDTGYGWYRTSFVAPKSGTYWLQIPFVADSAEIFINGERVPVPGNENSHQRPVEVQVTARGGANELAVLTWHYGRTKFFPYIGFLPGVDVKGMTGHVTLHPTQLPLVQLSQWESMAVEDGADAKSAAEKAKWVPTKSNSGLNNYPRPDHLKHGTVYYRITLPQVSETGRKVVFDFINDSGEVRLNDQLVGSVATHSKRLEIDLDKAWKKDGPNVLTVKASRTTDGGGMIGPVYFTAGTPAAILNDWKMRGNPVDADDPALKWSTEIGHVADGAKLYRTTFTYTPDPGHRAVLRFSSRGLSRGFVYLNGINVGRYPQRIPVEGTLLPEPWLKAGKNTLVILDDQGNAPGDARVIVEEVASRTVGTLVK